MTLKGVFKSIQVPKVLKVFYPQILSAICTFRMRNNGYMNSELRAESCCQ